jgi:putative nucleotidyltransferase with HDIG domain
MSSKRISVHKIIAIRLVVAWLLLSVCMGGAAYWLESRRMDRQVFELALEAVQYFNLPSEKELFEGDVQARIPALRALLRGSKFAAMRLYDKDHKLLLGITDAPDPVADLAMQKLPRAFPEEGEHHLEAGRTQGRMFVQALVPLQRAGLEPYGYFEGIFLVPPRTLEEIDARVRDTLWMVLIVTTLTTLALYPVVVSLNRDAVRLSRSLLESTVELMRVLGSAIAQRDSDTDSHNYRVALYAIHFAQELGRPSQEIASLIAGAFLHDVGKIGIPDGILLKPGRLTVEELDVMKTHATIGEEIVRESRWLLRASEVVAGHHEWFDGSGYPKGIKGQEIPFGARLFAIVDVFDALTSKRPYKDTMTLDQALEIMRGESGRHFDPGMLSTFEKVAGDYLKRFGSTSGRHLKAHLAESVDAYFPIHDMDIS